MKNNGGITLRGKFKKLSLEDEYRVRFLEGLPTKRIEKRILRRLRDKGKRKRQNRQTGA